MLNHIVKRGIAHLQGASPEYMAKLEADAALYENSGYGSEISPAEMLPVFITAFFLFLILSSIRYTVGDVVASLTMIESPGTVAIVEKNLPAYTDDEPLIPAESEVDAEITVVNRKPITASLCATMRHLRSAGGFFARWRGLGIDILYRALSAVVASIFSHTIGAFIFRAGLVGNAVSYIVASVILARVHMLWTHSMIAYPSSKSLRHRLVPRAQCKPLFFPTLIVAIAEHATLLVPLWIASLLGLLEDDLPPRVLDAAQHNDTTALALLGLRLLAVPLSAAFIALHLLLPATMVLTRIEAALLPDDAIPLVPFDRDALVGSIDLTARGASYALFVAAWRSVDRAARVRVLKLYVKMFAAQIAIAFIGVSILAAEVYVIGGERLAILMTSARAQVELHLIQAQGGSDFDLTTF